MKKIFRKNQIIITALALMIAVAGYISYTKTNVAENEAIQTAGDNVDNTYDISEGDQIGEIFTDTEDNTQAASAADAQSEDGSDQANQSTQNDITIEIH